MRETLFDENLSLRLAESLSGFYPGSAHVHSFGLGGADNRQTWDYAKTNRLPSISKDSDFAPKETSCWVLQLKSSGCASEIHQLGRRKSVAQRVAPGNKILRARPGLLPGPRHKTGNT
jgi:hypothetical protein